MHQLRLFRSHFGTKLGLSGAVLDHLDAILGPPWAISGPSNTTLDHFGSFWGSFLDHLDSILGWNLSKTIWGHSGTVVNHLDAILVHLGTICGDVRTILGHSEEHLGATLG